MKPIRMIRPDTLSLITSYRCTAACPNCCFNCSPHPVNNKIMTLEEMRRYISLAKEDFPNLAVVVFTGGECTLLGEDLYDAIKFAKSKGLITRVVTNGHWAKSESKAEETIHHLINSGLDEINFSTGSEHSMFTPVEVVAYAISKCVKTLRFSQVFVNIELSKGSNICIESFMNISWIAELDDSLRRRIVCVSSPWIEFRHKNKISKEDGCTYSVSHKGCTEVLSTININPNGQFLSCCGLACEYTPFLKLGHIHSDIKSLHESRFRDLLKLWLFVSGPYQILKKIGVHPQHTNRHSCEYCMNLLMNRENLNRLMNLDQDEIENILLDYHLKVHKYETIN